MPGASGPLTGLRLIDLADERGAYATKLLADLGAEVVRVTAPDARPMSGPRVQDGADAGASLRESYLSTNKRAVRLDLTLPADRELFEQLVTTADAIVETGAPGALGRLGLGFDRLKALRPGVILVSITPFGQDGPYAGYVADDLVTLAAGGLLSLGGYPDTAPIVVDAAQSTYASSLAAATALLIALIDRDGETAARWIDVSAQECIAGALEDAIPEFDLRGTVRRRSGDGPREAGSGVFACADGYVSMIAGRVGTAEAWKALVTWLREQGVRGADALAGEAWSRFEHRQTPEAIAEFGGVFNSFAATHSKSSLYEEAQRRGIALSPVNRLDEVLLDPQLAARDFFTTLRIGDREVVAPGAPYRFSRTPWRARSGDSIEDPGTLLPPVVA